MSENTNELPRMIDGFGDDKLFAECTKSDKNGNSLELGISEDNKIVTIGGREIAGVGGGNMVVLDGITSTWWDIARAQAEGKTVYLKFGIPGYFSSVVGPMKHALGTVDDGNKIQAIKRAWYATQYFAELTKINLAYRDPKNTVIPVEEGVEPVYQEGFEPFTYDEAVLLAYGKLPLERFDLYMYARGCEIYPGSEFDSETYTYRTYEVPAVPGSFDASNDQTLDFSSYVPGLDEPDTREKAQRDYERWLDAASKGGLSTLADLTGSSRPHVVKDYTSTDEYIRHLVGYYFDEIPDVILERYNKRLEQINMAFRAPKDEIVPVTEEPVYQDGYTPFVEGDALKLITGQLELAKFALFDYADEIVDEFYDPSRDATLDFSDYEAPDLTDPEVEAAVDADYDDWVAWNYQQLVQNIYGQLLPTVLGILYDTLLPYEVDVDITLAGFLRIGIGVAYKRSMPFITPRYVAFGLPNTYAVDLKSFKDAGADLSTIQGVIDTIGALTSGELVETLSGIGNGEGSQLGELVGGDSGIGGLIGGLIGGGNEKKSGGRNVSSVSLPDATLLKGTATRSGDNDGEDDGNGENDGEDTGESTGEESESGSLLSMFGLGEIDQETIAGLLSGISEATIGRNDDIFYLFALGMDVNRRLSVIPGLEDILGPDAEIDLDPHKGFIIDINGWNVFAPLTGDANKGLVLDEYIDELDQLKEMIEELGGRFPELAYVEGLIDAIGDLLGIGIGLDRALDILSQVNNMTLSFSTVLTQRAVYHLVEKGWPVSLLRYDANAHRLYSTQCLAKIAGATPSASVISISNFGGMIGTAIAELLIRALGNYNVEALIELVLGAASGALSGTPSGADEAIIDAFGKFAPLYGLEWHGLTEIPMALGLADGLPHDLANVNIRAGITFRADADEDGGTTGTGITGVFSRTKLSIENMESDFLRSYLKLNADTPFNDVYRAAILGKGVIYESIPGTQDASSADSNPENDELDIKSGSAESDTSTDQLRSWELHGEIVPTVYEGKKAVEMRIGTGDGSTVDMVGVENTENVPEYNSIIGASTAEKCDNRIIAIDGEKCCMSYHIFSKNDITGEGGITSLKLHCGDGTVGEYTLGVFIKDIPSTYTGFETGITAIPSFAEVVYDDLVYIGNFDFTPNGTLKIPVCTVDLMEGTQEPSYMPHDPSMNLLVAVWCATEAVAGDAKFHFNDTGNYEDIHASLCVSSETNFTPFDVPVEEEEPEVTEVTDEPVQEFTMTAMPGVVDVTIGFSEPYVIPTYQLPITIGEKNTQNSDDRIIEVDKMPHSVSYHLYRADDIKCSGEISSLTFYCDSGEECTRSIDVFMTSLPAELTEFPDSITKEALASEALVSWDDCIYTGKVTFKPNGTIEIPVSSIDDVTYALTPTTFQYNGAATLLVVIVDWGEYEESTQSLNFFYTPSDEDEPANRSMCLTSEEATLDPTNPDNFTDADLSFLDGAPTIQFVFKSGSRFDETEGEAGVGIGNLGHFGPIPVNTFGATYSESHMIYPGEYLGRGGLITGIRLYYSPYWEGEMTRHLKIYMRYTHFSSFTSETDFVEAPDENKDPMVDRDVTFISTFPTNGEGAQHWVDIPFDSGCSFAYNGFNNILVSVYDVTGNSYDMTGSFSLLPDTKNLMTIGRKVKSSVENGDSTITFGYNCVPVCVFVFGDGSSSSPADILGNDYITPDWEANRIVGSEPVEWKIVSTETRAVYVNTIQDAMTNYNWFAPQGIDVYLEYEPHTNIMESGPKSSTGYVTDINDFMPPWYTGGPLRFKVLEASSREGLLAVAEHEEFVGYYGGPVYSNVNDGNKSRSQVISAPTIPVMVKYYLYAHETNGAYIFAYRPTISIDIDSSSGYWNSEYYFYIMNPNYMRYSGFWAYQLSPLMMDENRSRSDLSIAYRGIDITPYYFFDSLYRNMVTVNIHSSRDAYQLDNCAYRYADFVRYDAKNFAEDGISTLYYAELFCGDNGEIQYSVEQGRSISTYDVDEPYYIGLYSDYREYEPDLPQGKSLVPPIELALEADSEHVYHMDYVRGVDIEPNTVNVITISDAVIEETVEIIETISEDTIRHHYGTADSPIPTNIAGIDLTIVGDGRLTRYLPESKVMIHNETTMKFIPHILPSSDPNDPSILVEGNIDTTAGTSVDLYIDSHKIGTIAPDEDYVIELVGPTFEVRKVSGGGIFLPEPPAPNENPGGLLE